VHVESIAALSDNYIYLIGNAKRVIVVDPGETTAVERALKGRTVEAILCTHHHDDHIGGVHELKQKYQCAVIGPKDSRIKELTQTVKDGDTLVLLGQKIEVLETSGHTVPHLTYFFPDMGVAFTGDALFSGGCGRIFEGTLEQMFKSLKRIEKLPGATKLYFGHEYTSANLHFALKAVPDDEHIQTALAQLHLPTTPTTVDREKEINVFMKAKTLNEFSKLRKQKDHS